MVAASLDRYVFKLIYMILCIFFYYLNYLIFILVIDVFLFVVSYVVLLYFSLIFTLLRALYASCLAIYSWRCCMY